MNRPNIETLLCVLAAEGERLKGPADTADYDAADDRGPADVTCRRCGRLAIDHTPGRLYIYGICPTLEGELTTRRAKRIESCALSIEGHQWEPDPQGYHCTRCPTRINRSRP